MLKRVSRFVKWSKSFFKKKIEYIYLKLRVGQALPDKVFESCLGENHVHSYMLAWSSFLFLYLADVGWLGLLLFHVRRRNKLFSPDWNLECYAGHFKLNSFSLYFFVSSIMV